MKRLRSLLSVLRWEEWVHSKLPILFSLIYYALLTDRSATADAYVEAAMLVWITVCYAAFGYVVNAWFDRSSDAKGGKSNTIGLLQQTKGARVVGVVTMAGMIPAVVWLHTRMDTMALVFASYAIALLYSMPPVRFKEHHLLGPIASTLAQRTFPALYIAHYFMVWDVVSVGLILLNTLVGIRYILIHQMDDVESDLQSGTNTLVTRIGIPKSKRIITRLVFPAEVFIMVFVGMNLGLLYVFSAIYISIYLVHAFIQWKYVRKYVENKFDTTSYDLLEDWYSAYFPILISILLVNADPGFFLFLIMSIVIGFKFIHNDIELWLILGKTLWVKVFGNVKKAADVSISEQDQIRQAKQRAIRALCALQQPDGSFPSIKWRPGQPTEPCHGLFITANILLIAGEFLPKDTIERAVHFVHSYRSESGTWNFFGNELIPDDSDDTSCAIACLAAFAPHRLSGNEAEVLRSFWRQDGGPFQTWMSDAASWTDRDRDDAVVNANVITALRSVHSTIRSDEHEAVMGLIHASLNGTRYYASPSTLYYAATRAGFRRESLPEAIRWRPLLRGSFLPRVEWMLAEDVFEHNSIQHLLTLQSSDGTWPQQAWFTGVGEPMWGSAALSTAFCLAAIHRCLEQQSSRS